MRALLAVDRAAHAALRAEAAARDELLCALLDDDTRRGITAEIYAREGTWRAGSRADREGLFAWELEALAHPCVPRAGRCLVAGCGGGRELAALRARGFEVLGFDPCAPLVDDARARFADDPGAAVWVGALQDLSDATQSPGPLRALRDQPVDLVIFGWTALSYVPDDPARLAALRATRARFPEAPVLLSAWGPAPVTGRARRALRRALAALGRQAPAGMTFRPWAGFVVALGRDALRDLAARAGYAVQLDGERPSPWALLTP
ncbi:MAG: methyltransferase domain-containing protein [Polyangiales bacterium]